MNRPQWKGDLAWIAVSLFLHVALLLALFKVSGIDPRHFFRASPTVDRSKPKAETTPPVATTDTLIEVKPFEGISWSEYTQRKADRSRQESTANAVLAKLKGLKFGGGAGTATAPTGGGASGAAPIEIGSSGDKPSLAALVSKQEYAVRSASIQTKEGVRKMTDAERAELKKRFRELEREFRKSFSQALNDDPELRVTIAFEAEIQANGYLAVRAFRPKGRYRPESLEKLKGAMGKGIGGVFIAQDLAGTLIRGESVFVK